MVLQGIFLAIWGPLPALPSTLNGLPDFEGSIGSWGHSSHIEY
jgi:hypothetical protein